MSSLPVMEHFYTLQGEGFHTGKAAYFIRLGGCDVGCVWCDVKESWDANAHPHMDIADITNITIASGTPMAVITGGEPLMHNLDALTSSLQSQGIKTNIETSGSSPLSGNWDWICLSPKKFKPALPEIYPFAHELKVVVFHPSDLAWAETHAAQVSGTCELFLQPEWSKQDAMLPLIIDYIKSHPRWRVSLQTHKFMQIP